MCATSQPWHSFASPPLGTYQPSRKTPLKENHRLGYLGETQNKQQQNIECNPNSGDLSFNSVLTGNVLFGLLDMIRLLLGVSPWALAAANGWSHNQLKRNRNSIQCISVAARFCKCSTSIHQLKEMQNHQNDLQISNARQHIGSEFP